MQVSGQLHVSAALPLAKEHPASIWSEDRWAPGPLWTQQWWRREKLPLRKVAVYRMGTEVVYSSQHFLLSPSGYVALAYWRKQVSVAYVWQSTWRSLESHLIITCIVDTCKLNEMFLQKWVTDGDQQLYRNEEPLAHKCGPSTLQKWESHALHQWWAIKFHFGH
jgi:hypothetical protein